MSPLRPIIFQLESWILLDLVWSSYTYCNLLQLIVQFHTNRKSDLELYLSITLEYSPEANNLFDQLCINYINERMQNFFVDLKLLEEKRWFDKQKMDVQFVEFLDNSPIIGIESYIYGSNWLYYTITTISPTYILSLNIRYFPQQNKRSIHCAERWM